MRDRRGGQTAALQLDLHSNCVIKTDLENKTDDKTDMFNGTGHLYTATTDKKRNKRPSKNTTDNCSSLFFLVSGPNKNQL